MKLRITTPLTVAVQQDGVTALRAEDASGSFGILPGHADFLTSLSISVVAWTGGDNTRSYCAVRHGVMTVTHGSQIEIASREAIPGDNLDTLVETVLASFQQQQDEERTGRVESTRLQLNAIRQIMRHLLADGTNAMGGFQ